VRLLLDWMPNPNHIPLYAGIQKGIFRHHGIDLVIKKMRDPSDSLTYLASGQAELAISYLPHTARSILRGVEVQLVGILVKEPLNALICRQEVKEAADLNDKVIGYCVDGSTCTFLKTLLHANRIAPKKMHNVSCDLTSALATGKVDAIYGGFWNIECEHLRLMGVETHSFPLSELGVPSYPELIILAKPQTDQASPLFMASFQDALQKSIDFCISHPEEAFAFYLDCHPDKGDKSCQWEKQAWLRTIPTLADTQKIEGDALFSRHISWLERFRHARG